jgi:hypothetical protein
VITVRCFQDWIIETVVSCHMLRLMNVTREDEALLLGVERFYLPAAISKDRHRANEWMVYLMR